MRGMQRQTVTGGYSSSLPSRRHWALGSVHRGQMLEGWSVSGNSALQGGLPLGPIGSNEE